MKIDIYTKRPIAEDSSEHVLPSSLGGRLQKRGLIDKTTNDTFGREIDAELAKALQSFRVAVGGLSDENRPSPPLRVMGDDGAEYSVGGDGTVSLVPQRPRFERRPEGLHVEAVFSGRDPESSMNALKTAVGVRARRDGYDDAAVEKLVTKAAALAKSQTSEPRGSTSAPTSIRGAATGRRRRSPAICLRAVIAICSCGPSSTRSVPSC